MEVNDVILRSKLKIVDFGVSKLLNKPLDMTKSRVGSKDTSAPEMTDSIDGYGLKSDIYSLGAVIYELYTGNKPEYTNHIIFDNKIKISNEI